MYFTAGWDLSTVICFVAMQDHVNQKAIYQHSHNNMFNTGGLLEIVCTEKHYRIDKTGGLEPPSPRY